MNQPAVKEAAVEYVAETCELPEGWVTTKLSGVIYNYKGKKPKKLTEEKFPDSVPYIDIKAFESGEIRRYADKDTSVIIDKGDVLMVWDGARSGLVGQAPSKGALGSTLMKLEPLVIHSDYLVQFLSSYFDTINSNPRGSGIPHVDPELFWNISVPLAPLAEQKRIVEKVKALLTRVNATRDRLSKVPTILKRFRQSVLAAACSGQLTADWREEHPDTESADELLERIRDSVLDQLEKKREIDMYKTMFDEYPPESSNDELPESWLSCRVGHIGRICNGSTPSRKRPEFWGGEINWVSSGEVQNNIIRKTRERITEAGFSNSSVRLLPPGTVLIAMIGEGKTRGQTAILEIESTINQNMAAINLQHGRLLSKYLWYWFQFQYLLTRQEGAGSGPPALNCQRVRELQFILPPFAEQKEIVRRVETLFAMADRIEQRTKAAAERVEKTTQSILARAFRGELVETEAELARREGRNYESAAQLLARIQTGREKSASTKPGRKSRKQRSSLQQT